MTDLARYRIGLTWPNGGPGVTTFWMSQGTLIGGWDQERVDVVAEDIYGVWQGLSPRIGAEVGWQIERAVDIVDVDSGALVNRIFHTLEDYSGSGSAGMAHVNRASQICVNLLTDVFTNGRQLRGRHFLGPVGDNAIDSSGYLETVTYQLAENVYPPLITGTGAKLAVYHRPPNGLSTGGSYGDVIAVQTKARPAILRSRRD